MTEREIATLEANQWNMQKQLDSIESKIDKLSDVFAPMWVATVMKGFIWLVLTGFVVAVIALVVK